MSIGPSRFSVQQSTFHFPSFKKIIIQETEAYMYSLISFYEIVSSHWSSYHHLLMIIQIQPIRCSFNSILPSLQKKKTGQFNLNGFALGVTRRSIRIQRSRVFSSNSEVTEQKVMTLPCLSVWGGLGRQVNALTWQQSRRCGC